ncbi:amino acid--tRNA ligase-related protein [Thermovibrio ammonificans]
MIEILIKRAKALEAVRRFFSFRSFVEVETPNLVPYKNPDDNVENVRATFSDWRGRRFDWYLHTSPEFFMKRLLWHGMERIFQVCKVYRDGETGPLHSVEFTMVEWYRVGADYRAGMEETLSLINEVAKALEASPFSEPVYLTVEEAYKEFAGVELSNRELVAERFGSGSFEEAFFRLLVEKVEPALSGFDSPVVLYDYPEEFSAVAKVEGGTARRFEVYLKGVEIANGYTELTTYSEYKRVFSKKGGAEDYGLLKLLEERPLPPCEGVALGFDRLVMVLTGSSCLKEVMPFSTLSLLEELPSSQ